MFLSCDPTSIHTQGKRKTPFKGSLWKKLKARIRQLKANFESQMFLHCRNLSSIDLLDPKLNLPDLCTDQNGSRVIQQKLSDASPEAVEVVFQCIMSDIVKLMTDVFGNYVVQKLLDRCTEEQKAVLVARVNSFCPISFFCAKQKLINELAFMLQTLTDVLKASPLPA